MSIERIKEVVAKRRCDRCFKAFLVEYLSEDPETPGILVCKDCKDEIGFEKRKALNPKPVKHYFK